MSIFRKKTSDVNSSFNDLEFLNRYIQSIEEVSNLMISGLPIQELLDDVIHLIPTLLGINQMALLYWLPDQKSFKLASVNVSKPSKLIIEKSLGVRLTDIVYPGDDPNNIFVQSINDKEVKKSTNIEANLFPALKNKSLSRIISAIAGSQFKLIISVPLLVNETPYGVLALGWESTEFSAQNEKIFKHFANLAAIAIHNSNNFNKEQLQLRILSQKNHDLQSLFYLTSRISQTLDPLKVAQNAVDSLPQNENMIGAILSLYDDTTSIIRVTAITTNEFSHQASNIVGDFTKFKIHINDPQAQNNPTVLTIKKGQPHYSDSLGPALSPPLPAKLVPVLEKFLKVSSTVDYPIFSRGKVVGTVSFLLRGKKFSELDENQRQLLNTYTTQIGIALENVLLFTRAQEIQRNLQDALDQLNEARRRERDMIDVMGHELRTPISIVRNALAVLDADFKRDGSIARDRLAKYLDIGLESVRREITLIETLLSATKIDSHKIQLTLTKVDMADVVRDALEAEQYRATGKGIKIILNEPRKPLLAFADRIRTQEIVDNLLSNAIKYTEKGTITINMSMEGDNAYLEVVDTGIGISPEDIEHLGKKFFRAKQFQSEFGLRPSGTGLGLFVAFELVRIMGGKKVITSTPGKGSTFAFYLPLYQGQADKHVEEGFMPG